MTMANTDYFELALQGDPGHDRNLMQFLIRMAGRGETVRFGFKHRRPDWSVLVASTGIGQYEFLFDQDDNLVLDQVL